MIPNLAPNAPRFAGRLTYTDGTLLQPGPLTTFTHVSDKGVVRVWHIERMIEMARSKEVWDTPVDAEFAQIVRDRRGVEAHRLARISPADLTFPVIYVEMEAEFDHDPPISHLLVDGNHRYVKAAEWGRETIPGVIFSKAEADRCLIVGIPSVTEGELLSRHSGIA